MKITPRHFCIGVSVLATLLFSIFARPASAAGPATPLSDNARREIQSLIDEKNSWTSAQQKLESQLIHALKRNRGEAYAPGAPNLELDFKAQSDGRALVDITATVTSNLLTRIQQGGGQVINDFPQFNSIRALIPLSDLESLAALPEITSIRRAARSHHNAVDAEGNAAHAAPLARSVYNVSGAGVKVGVLSDSVDHLSTVQASGDLGSVTVLSGQSGVPATGEGTAMLEIVHAIAPNAQLFFATANTSEASFANNILALRTAGCDIIVDDTEYFDESPFQDGPVASAVNSVTAAGALYFSSAGNSGNLDSGMSSTWEGDFVDGGAVSSPETGHIHSFGPLTYNTAVTASSQEGVNLYWSDPLGGSSNDYDLFVLNSTGTSVLRSSTTRQTGTQNPYESVATLNAGERIVIVRFSGANRFLRISTGDGLLTFATSGATDGHAAAVNAFDVAAIDTATANPNPFTGGQANPVEVFSSDGPRHVFYNQDGSAITPGNFSSTGGAIRQKPDLAAADDVTTSVPGFTPFFGTSAAAPHAAAIAALLKSYNPALTPAEIRTVLTTSALDDMLPGVDRDSGFGIVMPGTALAAAPPDGFLITPGTALASSGPQGGPFNSPALLVLTNTGGATFNWTLTNTAPWLNVSLSSGSLVAGGAASTVSVTLNSTATNLPPGNYNATLWFTNLTDLLGQSRQVNLTVVGPPHGAFANSILSFAPVGYWRLNETNPVPGPDVVTNVGSFGSAANGLGANNVLQGQPGIVGNSFHFSNSNQDITFFGAHVDVPYQTAFNPNGAFTVELWAKPSITTTDLFCPIAAVDLSQNGGNSRAGWLFYQNGSAWQFRVGGFSGYAATVSGGSAQINVWHHLVGVYDGANASLYVDGSSVSVPTSAAGFSPNTTVPIRIGATTIPNRTFDGWVDEVAFYNSALSAGVIAAHFAAVTTNNAGYGAQILAAHPLGYWHLDEPPFTTPTQNSLPVATNIGTIAPVGNGIYQPGCITGVPGAPDPGLGSGNFACQFSGTGFIDVPGEYFNFSGAVTLLAWIKANPANGLLQPILSKGAASFRLFEGTNGLLHFADGAQPGGDLVSPGRIDDQQWHLLTGEFDGNHTENLYIDAQLVASTTSATAPVVGNSDNIQLGGDPESGALFNGVIDEVALLTNVLSAAQLQQIYSLATNTPPAPQFISGTTATNGITTFTWTAAVGQTYQVQYKTNFSQPAWNNLGAPTNAATTTITRSDISPSDRQRFYRIVLE